MELVTLKQGKAVITAQTIAKFTGNTENAIQKAIKDNLTKLTLLTKDPNWAQRSKSGKSMKWSKITLTEEQVNFILNTTSHTKNITYKDLVRYLETGEGSYDRKTKYLYIIQQHSWYKIGIATNLKSRTSAVQTGSPIKQTLLWSAYIPKAQTLERLLHKKYKLENGLGEWFKLTEKDLDSIKQYVENWKIKEGEEDED